MNHARILLALLAAVSAQPAWAQATTPAAPVAAPQARPGAGPAAEAFKAWDQDHNGSLSLAEFRAGWQQLQRVAETQARLHHQFSTVDANSNNAIDPAEYGSLLLVRQAGKSAPQMSMFDADRDGKLQFGEYLKLVQALAPRGVAK